MAGGAAGWGWGRGGEDNIAAHIWEKEVHSWRARQAHIWRGRACCPHPPREGSHLDGGSGVTAGGAFSCTSGEPRANGCSHLEGLGCQGYKHPAGAAHSWRGGPPGMGGTAGRRPEGAGVHGHIWRDSGLGVAHIWRQEAGRRTSGRTSGSRKRGSAQSESPHKRAALADPRSGPQPAAHLAPPGTSGLGSPLPVAQALVLMGILEGLGGGREAPGPRPRRWAPGAGTSPEPTGAGDRRQRSWIPTDSPPPPRSPPDSSQLISWANSGRGGIASSLADLLPAAGAVNCRFIRRLAAVCTGFA